jgi:hypothetical protein
LREIIIGITDIGRSALRPSEIERVTDFFEGVQIFRVVFIDVDCVFLAEFFFEHCVSDGLSWFELTIGTGLTDGIETFGFEGSGTKYCTEISDTSVETSVPGIFSEI